jgi:hypothetical protein
VQVNRNQPTNAPRGRSKKMINLVFIPADFKHNFKTGGTWSYVYNGTDLGRSEALRVRLDLDGSLESLAYTDRGQEALLTGPYHAADLYGAQVWQSCKPGDRAEYIASQAFGARAGLRCFDV